MHELSNVASTILVALGHKKTIRGVSNSSITRDHVLFGAQLVEMICVSFKTCAVLLAFRDFLYAIFELWNIGLDSISILVVGQCICTQRFL